ncbi:MAG: division/cell wall cluster transcriptional repressor MraZ [candidate division Zixibacteria bacterium RBG_16_53_22]|nr:MAG: division/cell wall cluster transcriptional repressor MraZ [candidate division Zixibacteria bacterium RBG_16_53_22]
MENCGTIWEIVGERANLFAFKGTYYNSVDHKGRMSIPAKFRDMTDSPSGDHYVLARGFDGCLYLYPLESWLRVQQKIAELKTISDRRARYFMHTLIGQAADVKLDKLGRIMIPQILLDLAGIKKDVVVIGVLDKMELWDPEILKKYEDNQPESYEDVAGQLLI